MKKTLLLGLLSLSFIACGGGGGATNSNVINTTNTNSTEKSISRIVESSPNYAFVKDNDYYGYMYAEHCDGYPIIGLNYNESYDMLSGQIHPAPESGNKDATSVSLSKKDGKYSEELDFFTFIKLVFTDNKQFLEGELNRPTTGCNWKIKMKKN